MHDEPDETMWIYKVVYKRQYSEDLGKAVALPDHSEFACPSCGILVVEKYDQCPRCGARLE